MNFKPVPTTFILINKIKQRKFGIFRFITKFIPISTFAAGDLKQIKKISSEFNIPVHPFNEANTTMAG